MEHSNDPIFNAINAATAGAQNSIAFPMKNVKFWGFQYVATGSPVGTLKLQTSLDVGNPQSGAGITNWDDVANSSTDISAAGSGSIIYTGGGVEWIRAVYTKSSGTGAISARLVRQAEAEG